MAGSDDGGQVNVDVPLLDRLRTLHGFYEELGDLTLGQDWKPAGTPIIRIQNLTNPAAPFNYAEGPFPEDGVVEDGDILVSWSATLNAFLWGRGTAVVNQHIFKVIPDERVVTAPFLLHLLRYCIRVMAESEAAHGLVMQHINRGPFLSFVVGIPPIAEQGRIVDALDEMNAHCDAVEECQQSLESVRGKLVSLALSN